MASVASPPSSSSPHHPSAAAAIIVAAAAAGIVAASVRARRREREGYEARVAKLEETRRAERTGRIRAEMKLRTHLKNHQEDHHSNGNSNNRDDGAQDQRRLDDDSQRQTSQQQQQQQQHDLLLQCIGTIVSPYTKRMGTPRQGALVPSGRGYLQLRVPVECVDGLDRYSHAWILFTFHANTDAPGVVNAKSSSNHSSRGAGGFANLTKTKIRPPRGNGIKVGMLATRSPHRPNNIGLSLVRIDRVDKKSKRLHISGLDLVNGTPVYDVKPCVPWDMPGYHDGISLEVPPWVSQDDELKSVNFSTNAKELLERCIVRGKLAPLYTAENDGVDGAARTIREILAQDPRASNSNGPNKRGSKMATTPSSAASRRDAYKMLFCSVEIEFCVGVDGVVVVENIRDLDLGGVHHVDGIPILLK